jgi:alanine racemase
MDYEKMMALAKENNMNDYQQCVDAIIFVRSLFVNKIDEARELRDKHIDSKIFQTLLEKSLDGFSAFSKIENEIWNILDQAEKENKIS